MRFISLPYLSETIRQLLELFNTTKFWEEFLLQGLRLQLLKSRAYSRRVLPMPHSSSDPSLSLLDPIKMRPAGFDLLSPLAHTIDTFYQRKVRLDIGQSWNDIKFSNSFSPEAEQDFLETRSAIYSLRRLQFHTVLVYGICTVDDKLYNCIVHFILDNLNNSIALGKESSKFVTLGF